MRSCASPLLIAVLMLALGGPLQAQTAAADAYRGMRQRDITLRQQLGTASPSKAARATVLKNVRAIVADYEKLSRTYRTTGYGDDALWQAATLSGDAFRTFGETADRQNALRLLADLADRFPASSLNAKAPAYKARLTPATAPKAPPLPAPIEAKVSAPGAATTRGATLTDIRHEVLPDVVRITLFLENETAYTSERLDNPARLSIDLAETRVIYRLKDARVRYGDDPVKQVRVGPFERGRTRIVVDLDRAGRFSIYPVYNPYRLVIDFERDVRARSLVAAAESSHGQKAVATTKPTAATPVQPAAPPPPAAQPSPAASASAAPTPTPAKTNPAGPGTSKERGVSLSRQLGLGAARVVIDAGHGGHDPGAQSGGLDEAALVLEVALELERLLRAEPGVDVIMTRRTNEYVALEERTAIANRAGADLFLSIHANASTNRSAHGIETYFLNFAPNAEAEAIAARENAGSTRTMRNLTDIVRAIALNDKLDESRDFATRIQSTLYTELRKTNREAKNLGVKQAPFQVLIGATMPSVLAEISFITHEREGELLKTEKYRTQIARALFDGIMAYQRSLKAVRMVAEK